MVVDFHCVEITKQERGRLPGSKRRERTARTLTRPDDPVHMKFGHGQNYSKVTKLPVWEGPCLVEDTSSLLRCRKVPAR